MGSEVSKNAVSSLHAVETISQETKKFQPEEETRKSKSKPKKLDANYATVSEWKRTIENLRNNTPLVKRTLSKTRKDFQSLEKLVKFFSQNGTKNKLELAWSIYVWVTHNIVYDLYSFKNKQNTYISPEAVFHSGKAVCSGYTSLFEYICVQNELECLKITGHSKVSGSIQGHAWNAVKIDNTWHHVETTWGSGKLGNENNKLEFKATFNPHYFMTPAHIFNEDHFSDQFKPQLGSAAPFWTLKEFEKRPNRSLNFHLLGIYFINLTQSEQDKQEISTNKSTLFIELNSDEQLNLMLQVFGKKGRQLIELAEDAAFVQYDFSNVLKRYGVFVFLNASLYFNYTLNMFAKKKSSPNTEAFHKFNSFVIKLDRSSNSNDTSKDFYDLDSVYLTDHFDFELASHRSKLIKFDRENYFQIQFRIKSLLKPCEMDFKLVKASDPKTENNFFWNQSIDGRVDLFLKLSEADEEERFKLSIYAKVGSSNEFINDIYLLSTKDKPSESYLFHKDSSLNINKSLSNDLSLTLTSHSTPFIKCDRSKEYIILNFKTNSDLLMDLLDFDTRNAYSERYIFIQNKYNGYVDVYIAFPVPNCVYTLKIYAQVKNEDDFWYINELYLTSSEIGSKIKFIQTYALPNSPFYVEQPLESELTVNREYSFKAHFKEEPIEVGLNETATNEMHYLIQDGNDKNLWSIKISLKSCGDVHICAKYEQGTKFSSICKYSIVNLDS